MHGCDEIQQLQSGKAEAPCAIRYKEMCVAEITLAVCRLFSSIADSAHLSIYQLLAALVSSASHALAGSCGLCDLISA